jgi:DNA-binding PucR family transcriptional regulator
LKSVFVGKAHAAPVPRSYGETVRRNTIATGDEQLTPQEAQIALMARDDLSNPEVGARDLADEDREILFETFQVWQDSDALLRRAAEVLFCHPNTVRTRLRRIETVFGVRGAPPSHVAEIH